MVVGLHMTPIFDSHMYAYEVEKKHSFTYAYRKMLNYVRLFASLRQESIKRTKNIFPGPHSYINVFAYFTRAEIEKR